MISMEKIRDAASVLQGVAYRTTMIHAKKMSTPQTELYLKAENLQLTGSFKLRGAYYKISKLSEEEKKNGIIACSAGNHAQGVALAAQRRGIPCVICMPEGSPLSKVEATRSYGAEVCLVKGVYDDAAARAVELQQRYGYTFIHPFNDEDVIAGQGTVGLEIAEQLPEADVVLVPIGGGGLAGGVAYAIKHLLPHCKVYGVQATGAAGMYQSLKDHKIETLPSVSTLADGIAVKTPGSMTFELAQNYLDGVVTVSEDELAQAILALAEKQKLVTEGAGAASVAAALFQKVDLEGKKVVCILSGGNIDVSIFSRIINRALLISGRNCSITMLLRDQPGAIEKVSNVIGAEGANILSIRHNRDDVNVPVNCCVTTFKLETRDRSHVQRIRDALKEAGFELTEE